MKRDYRTEITANNELEGKFCPSCGGSGKGATYRDICPKCKGSGRVEHDESGPAEPYRPRGIPHRIMPRPTKSSLTQKADASLRAMFNQIMQTIEEGHIDPTDAASLREEMQKTLMNWLNKKREGLGLNDGYNPSGAKPKPQGIMNR